jgi:hypothetical protein
MKLYYNLDSKIYSKFYENIGYNKRSTIFSKWLVISLKNGGM